LAETIVGDVLARLRLDASQFDRALADAVQRLHQLTQAQATVRQSQGQSQQATAQLAQSYQGLVQAVGQQTQAYASATGATSAYKQSQDAAKAATQQTTTALSQQTQAMTASTSAVTSAGGALKSAFAVAGGFGIATSIGAIVSQMKELAVSTVQVGAQFQQLRTSLSAVTGGQGAQAFQFLTDTANRYGFSLTNLATQYRSLAAATKGTNLEGEQTRRLFEAVTAASRTLGSSSEQVGRALQALQQIASKGVVSMEELRQQLGESLPGAFQIAARAMGVTTERLNEMVASGQVLSTDFLPKFARQLQQELGQGAVQAANTAQAAFARLENEWQALKERIARSGPLTFVTRLAGFLAGNLEEDRKRLEEEQARIERQARQQTFTPGPSARPRPGSLETGTEAELDRLKAINAEWEKTQATIADIRKNPGLLPKFMQESEIKRFTEQATALEREQRQLQATINARRLGQQGVAARGGAEEDRTEIDTERIKANEAANKRLNDALTAKQKLLKDNAALYERAPELLSSTTNKAELETAKLNAALKVRRDGLEELLKQEQALGTAVDPELRAKIDATRTAIQADEERKESIERRVAAEKKAAQEAIQATREAAAEAKRAQTDAVQLDARLESLRGFVRRPDESKAEEAATRVRVEGARRVAEIEKEILTLQQSQSLQKLRPEALGQFHALRQQVLDATEAQAQLASEEVLKKQIAPLEELAVKYGLVKEEVAGQSDAVRALATTYNLTTKEVLDLVQAENLAAELKGTAKQAEAEKYLQIMKDTVVARAKIEGQVPGLEQEARASFGPGLAAVSGVPVTADLERQLEQLRAPREERVSTRARQRAARGGRTVTPEQEALLAQIQTQERVNAIMKVSEQVGDQAAQTITDGLLRIVDGTTRVGEGFQLMAKSILRSIAQITLNEGFKQLISLGLTAVAGAFAPGATVAAPAATGAIGGGLAFRGFQHGGVVSKPTLAMIGEGGGHEFVLNSRQMQAALTSAVQAAGTSPRGPESRQGDVVIINVPNAAAGDREAAQQRAMGNRVILNVIEGDLSQGSGSRIRRVLRAGGM
jgi:tape measure domain-containing protein